MDMDLAARSREIDAKDLGQRIKGARVAAGLTQTQLARDAVTAAYISRIEAGQRRPELKLLVTLADRLGVDLASLLGATAPHASDSPSIRLELDYAELHLATGNTDEALQLARHARDQLEDTPHANVRRRAHFLLAAALEAAGDIDDAVAHLGEIVSTPTPDIDWLKAVIALSRCYREAGEYPRAVAVGEEAVPLVADLGLAGTTEAIQLTLTLAGAYLAQGDLTHAMVICSSALRDAEAIDSTVGRGSAYWNASVILSKRGEHSAALDMARKALSAFEAGDDFRNLARLRTQVGILHLRQDPPEPEAAKTVLSAAQNELRTTSSNVFDRAEHWLTLARAHLMLDDHETALQQVQETLAMVGDTSPTLSAAAHTVQGQILMARRDVGAAQEAYRSAVHHLARVAADRHIAETWFELAGLLETAGLADVALDAYRRGATAIGLAQMPRTARASLQT